VHKTRLVTRRWDVVPLWTLSVVLRSSGESFLVTSLRCFLPLSLRHRFHSWRLPSPKMTTVRTVSTTKTTRTTHNWDDHENHAWQQYLAEKHNKDHEFSKANKKEQSDYWNWRHSHPD
jgi:hypothetical protein